MPVMKRRPARRSAKAPPTAKKSPSKRNSQKRATPTTSEPIVFETGSGNVFADMEAPDAEDRLAKAELARVPRTRAADAALLRDDTAPYMPTATTRPSPAER